MDALNIDGLGLTFDDLSDAGKQKAIFILLKRNQFQEALTARLSERTKELKAQQDEAQDAFDKVGRKTEPTATSRSESEGRPTSRRQK